MERKPAFSKALALSATLLLISTSLLNVQSQTSTTLVPAIIIFGDSSVDVGNNDYLRSIFKADFPPYGRDFKNHEATGRFCNGKLVTDFTAEILGFTASPAAYLSPQASGRNLLIGANFASAGSGYYDNTSILYDAIPLSKQLKYLKRYKSKLVNVAGSSKAASIISEALYILSTGNGDFVQNYYINPNLRKVYSTDVFSSMLVGIFSNFVKDLYKVGARRIGVTSLPPLGCLPASITLYGQGNNGCIARMNSDALVFNKKLNAAINSLKSSLPQLKIAIFDIYQPLYDISTSPSKNGFFEARRSCCGSGTMKAAVLCKPKSEGICPNATGYVFWDGVHPSEAANKVIADSLLVQGIGLIA